MVSDVCSLGHAVYYLGYAVCFLDHAMYAVCSLGHFESLLQTVLYLPALSQLCHCTTDLTHSIWVDIFPRIWKILSEKQQGVSCITMRDDLETNICCNADKKLNEMNTSLKSSQ